jgi:hypothetical protein
MTKTTGHNPIIIGKWREANRATRKATALHFGISETHAKRLTERTYRALTRPEVVRQWAAENKATPQQIAAYWRIPLASAKGHQQPPAAAPSAAQQGAA